MLDTLVNGIQFLVERSSVSVDLVLHNPLCVAYKSGLTLGKHRLNLVDETSPILGLGLSFHSSQDDARGKALPVNRLVNVANELTFLLNGLLRAGFHHLGKNITDNGYDEIQKYDGVNQHKDNPDYPAHVQRRWLHSFVATRLEVSKGSAKDVQEIYFSIPVQVEIVVGRVVLCCWRIQSKKCQRKNDDRADKKNEKRN